MPDNQPLLWTGPRRVGMLFYSLARPARRVAGHRAVIRYAPHGRPARRAKANAPPTSARAVGAPALCAVRSAHGLRWSSSANDAVGVRAGWPVRSVRPGWRRGVGHNQPLLWTGPHAATSSGTLASVGACVTRHRASIVIPASVPRMSVNLAISRPGRRTEIAPLCVQAAADRWVPEVARRRGFKVLDGTWPIWVYPDNLAQVLHEVCILRQEACEFIDEPDDRFSETDRAAQPSEVGCAGLELGATQGGDGVGRQFRLTRRDNQPLLWTGPRRVHAWYTPTSARASRCRPQSVGRYPAGAHRRP